MVGRDHRTRVLLFGNFLCEVWTGNCAHMLAWREIAEQLAHKTKSLRLNALGGTDQ